MSRADPVPPPRVRLRLPAALRDLAGATSEIDVQARTVHDALCAAGRQHEGLIQRLLSVQGELRPFVRVYIGDTEIRQIRGLATPLSEGDVIRIIPAVAGG